MEQPLFVIPSLIDSSLNTIFGDLCSSDNNNYIPTSSLIKGTLLSYPNGTNKFLYNLEHPHSPRVIRQRYPSIVEGLHNNTHWTSFATGDLASKYMYTSGTIVTWPPETNDYKYLVALCIKKEYLFITNNSQLDPTHFCLVISIDILKAEHEILYRNLKKLYFPKIMQQMDVIHTHDIYSTIAKPIRLTPPQFSTVSEMVSENKKLNNILKENLFNVGLF